MKSKESKKLEFSKALLIQESILIWIITIVFLVLAFVCIAKDYLGELSWLTAMCALPWTAYGVSQAFYYRKSEKENTIGGIKYDTVMAQLYQSSSTEDAPLFDSQDNSNEELDG